MFRTNFEIELAQPFDHLPLAPVVEAVLQFRSRISGEWEPERIREALLARLPQFAKIEFQHRFELDANLSKVFPTTPSRKQVCHALRAENEGGTVVAEFSRDGLVFSQLKPYRGWELFIAEARRVCSTFIELTLPTEIQRLGIRFINRIDAVNFQNVGEYLREPPSLPRKLPLNGFLYQSTFDVTGHDLGVNVVKTIQPTSDLDSALLIDIDVFTTQEMPCAEQRLDDKLPTMRWLKNMVFFELLTPQAINNFRGTAK